MTLSIIALCIIGVATWIFHNKYDLGMLTKDRKMSLGKNAIETSSREKIKGRINTDTKIYIAALNSNLHVLQLCTATIIIQLNNDKLL